MLGRLIWLLHKPMSKELPKLFRSLKKKKKKKVKEEEKGT